MDEKSGDLSKITFGVVGNIFISHGIHMNRRAISILLCPTLLLMTGSTDFRTSPPPESQQIDLTDRAPRLSGRIVELPLVFVKGFPFVESEVAGRRGKLMFDLGNVPALTINSHAFPNVTATPAGEGHFGSGQTTVVTRYPAVTGLRLGHGLNFGDVKNIEGRDGRQLETGITKDFLGWIGLGIFDGYAARIDYARKQVSFFKDSPTGAGMRVATRQRRMVERIAIPGVPGHPNLRQFAVSIGATKLTASIDSGFHTTVWLDPQEKAAMKRSGYLRESSNGRSVISSIRIGTLTLAPMPVDVVEEKPVFARFLPQPDRPFIILGYEFFDGFVVSLDYRGQQMVLQEPDRRTSH